MSIFERASKQKLRFSTSKGSLSVEDLWDLSLESLDTIAVKIDQALQDSGTKSFIGKKNTENTKLTLQLEILKYIIQVKLDEKERKAKRVEKQAKLAQLQELYASKSNEELQSKSREEIQKMIADLEEEDTES